VSCKRIFEPTSFEDQRRIGLERLLPGLITAAWIVFHLDEIGRGLLRSPDPRCDADHRLTDVTHLLIARRKLGRVGSGTSAALRAGELRDSSPVITA